MYGKLLNHYPVLASVPRADLERALAHSQVVHLPAGHHVFDEQQICHAFPFVLAGRLRVVKRAENGREIALYHVAPGDACVVTAACLFGKEPYQALGIVQSDCELVMVPAADFDRLLTFPEYRAFVFSLFAKRVLGLMQLVDEVAFHRLDQRLARWLLDQGPDIDASHQQIADELGTVREIVSRLLGGFGDQGSIRLSRGRVHILDHAALQKISEPM